MKRIMIDASALLKSHPTGVERYARQLLLAMMRLPVPAGVIFELVAKGALPADIALPPQWLWRSLSYPLKKGFTHVRLSLELLVRPPDVYFAPAHEIPFLHRGTRIVTTVHDVVQAFAPQVYQPSLLKRLNWATKRAVKEAESILAVSASTKSDLVRFFKADADRITVTPLASGFADDVAVLDVGATLRALRLAPSFYVLYVGRLEAKKNVATLVRAFTLLKERLGVGHPLKLVLVGSRGYQYEKIQAEIADSLVKEDIVELGFVRDEQLLALYSGAFATVLPSIGEGFGLPVLEAMRFGSPVIASDIPVMHEVCGEAALYAAPSDAPAFAARLSELVFSGVKRDELIEKGKLRVAHFSWEATAQKTLGVLLQ
ncbi:glycosyltransferase family 4 protein [Patescibacteria group bacterium]|nr:glycosyltransferase family 4 protein [Patescibacteria group bacterium]